LAKILRTKAVGKQGQRSQTAALPIQKHDQKRRHKRMRMHVGLHRRTVSTDCCEVAVAAQYQTRHRPTPRHVRQRKPDQEQQERRQPRWNRTRQHGSRGHDMSQRLDEEQTAGWFEGNRQEGDRLHRQARLDATENQ
jgi:hypothetical protein